MKGISFFCLFFATLRLSLLGGTIIVKGPVLQSAGGITYLLNETFEGSTSGWTANSGTGGVADLAYTASPLSGSKSARVMEASGDCTLTWDLVSSYAALEGSFEFKAKSSYSTSNLSNRLMFRLENSGGTAMGAVMVTTTSSGTVVALNAKMLTVNGTATSATFGLDTKIYVWWAWDNTTDTMTIWWDTTNTKPVGDSTKTATATSATTSTVRKLALFSDAPDMNHVLDEVKVWQP